jgi:hypothetical protein
MAIGPIERRGSVAKGRRLLTGVMVLIAVAVGSRCSQTPNSPSTSTHANPQTPRPVPAPFPPFATPPKIWTLTGTVVDELPTGPRPVSDAGVSVWMQVPNGGYAAGGATTDDAGHFSIGGLPAGTVRLYAFASGARQPCAVIFDIAANMSHDVEVVLDPSFVGTSLPPDMSTPPVLTGMVYETTSTGRLPVAGASLETDAIMDLVTATTTTDANGRYQLCGLPGGTKGFWQTFDLWAWKDGYGLAYSEATLTGPVTSLDIEIRHTGPLTSRSTRSQKDSRKPN